MRRIVYLLIVLMLAPFGIVKAASIGDGEIAMARKKFEPLIKEVKLDKQKDVVYYTVNAELAEKYLERNLQNNMSSTEKELLPLMYMCAEDLNKLILTNQDMNNAEAVAEVSKAMGFRDKFQTKIDEYNAWVEAKREIAMTAKAKREAEIAKKNADYLASLTPEQREKYSEAENLFTEFTRANALVDGIGLQTKDDISDQIGSYFEAEQNGGIEYRFGSKLLNIIYTNNVFSKITFRLTGEEAAKYEYSITDGDTGLKYERSYNVHNMAVKSHPDEGTDDTCEVRVYKNKKKTTCEIFHGIDFTEFSFYNFNVGK